MVTNIKILVSLAVKRIDLLTKFISILFIMILFTNYLHDCYYVNILDLRPLLPEVIQLLLQKVEFFLYWALPFFLRYCGSIRLSFYYQLYFIMCYGLFEKEIFCLFGQGKYFWRLFVFSKFRFNHNSNYFWYFLYGKYILYFSHC